MKGSLADNILEAVLETLPVDFTVIDADDKVLAWNKHEGRRFRRGESVLGKDVRSCHRAESTPMIESILTRLKSSVADKVEFWIERPESENAAMRVVYWALRDKDGKYIGCMETTQTLQKDRSAAGEAP